MIELFASDTPNGKKISIMLEEIEFPYKVTAVDLGKGDHFDPKFKEIIVSKIPSARLGDPQDIANAVLFLASSQSDYINGETLHVNGGLYMA